MAIIRLEPTAPPNLLSHNALCVALSLSYVVLCGPLRFQQRLNGNNGDLGGNLNC